jgi:hypothetical protein
MKGGLIMATVKLGAYDYEGDLNDGLPCGEGKMTYEGAVVYEGDFYLSKGKFISNDGQVYEGNFVNGKLYGKGKYSYEKFSTEYEGDFVDGEYHGKGNLKSAGGNVYEGDFANSCFHGKGKYINYLGVFEGDFVEGNITKGKFTGNNGDTYEGNFTYNFMKNGEGKYTFIDGKVEDGYWLGNKYMGEGAAGKLKMEAEIRAKEEEKNETLSDYDLWMEQLKGER